MRPIMIALATLTFAAAAGIAHGAPGTAQHTRHEGFEAMGKAMKVMGDQLKSGAPDKKILLANAQLIDRNASKIPSWFPKGSGSESGQKTQARAEIWTKWPEFKADADALKVESVKLVAAAKVGDPASFGGQLKATGEACGACHKVFRNKDA